MKDKLDKELVKESSEKIKELALQFDKLDARICYIYSVIKKVFDKRFREDNFDYPECGLYLEDYSADMRKVLVLNTCIGFIEVDSLFPVSLRVPCKGMIIKRENIIIDLSQMFPTKWLFEDFEDEITLLKKQHEDDLIKEKNAREKNIADYKEQQQKIYNSIRNKLTEEEMSRIIIK